jgi:hypothetical protein
MSVALVKVRVFRAVRLLRKQLGSVRVKTGGVEVSSAKAGSKETGANP